MKKITKKAVMDKANADNPVVTAPLIDKLSAVVDLKDVALCSLAFSSVIDWLNYHEIGMVKVPAAGKYQLAVKIHFPTEDGLIQNSGPFLLLQITNPKVSKRQVRLEYNPAHMTEIAEDYLNVQFTELFGVEFYQLLYHARFTRVDVCRNIMDRSLGDYLIKAKWKKVSQCFFGADGSLQTINLGGSGNNQVVAYDKAAQLHGPAATHSTIRVEARCRINLTIHGLAAFKNPLMHVDLYSMACKCPPFGVAHWRAFQDACRLRGISNAIKNQPAECRAKLKKVLSTLPVTWWSIADEDWDFLWTAALEDAGLTQIPDWAPPLVMNYQAGQAA